MIGLRLIAVCCALAAWVPGTHAAQRRQTLSLDGTWSVAESVERTARPTSFPHRAPVPGLVHSATPAFVDVDRFDSREYLSNMVVQKRLPPSALTKTAGISHQKRNYFWYRTSFAAPARRELAMLTVNKAQFGSQVWVNGRSVGEHIGCSTSKSYDVTRALRWSDDNEVVIRIGAHPGVLPEGDPCGIDFEKTLWTPGIYDSVSVSFSDALTIDTVQVAPRIEPREILVQTSLRNTGSAAQSVALELVVHPWKESARIGSAKLDVSVAAGETKVVTTKIALPDAHLWSPDDPKLYVVELSTPGDNVATRFGIRELRFETATRRAYLNGKPYFLRGSNITLHRFFEDPLSKQLPWDDAWVRKLLGEKAQQMHWNFMRFCIGAVPQRWLDIADETGLMLQYEFPIWVLSPRIVTIPHVKEFDADQLVPEFAAWMRDAWNHPSVVLWDASNESELPMLGEKVIPAVRGLDLSGRQWENSYNPPSGPDDPVEDHPYEFVANAFPGMRSPFDMTELETRSGSERSFITPPTGHALINNEYGWLWLNRKGSPTLLTEKVYPELPYPNATATERLATNAYLLAGLTEYWRAFRNYAAVMHFVYLTGSVPNGYTADHFEDVTALKLHADFATYVAEAFKPLGVYLNFWQREVPAGMQRDFQVMMINDDDVASAGNLSLVLEDESGRVVAQQSTAYSLAAFGQQTHFIRMQLPDSTGKYVLKAVAAPSAGKRRESTTSRRMFSLITKVPPSAASP